MHDEVFPLPPHLLVTRVPSGVPAFVCAATPISCYKETQQQGTHRESETRAGNHQKHTRTRNISLPTQANHTARGARKQPPKQGATHAASEDTTHTSNHTACHQRSKRRRAWHPPRAKQGATPISTIGQALRASASVSSRVFGRRGVAPAPRL